MTKSVNYSRRRLLKNTAVASALVAGSSSVLGETNPQLQTRSGGVSGTRRNGLNIFKGIPYAASTQGRRFLPPLKEEAWHGLRDAAEYAKSAPQRSDESYSEDCLYLNCWTPGLSDGGKRPILFYIHGGGYATGSGSDPLYDGSSLCHQGDVVVVTVNHRLNAFGYLYLADLAGDEYAHSGNVGQLDLIAALRWVQEHAEALGGDRHNVTVFGQSGGGAKIATLMAMPMAKELFHRAWTMSGQQVTAAGPRSATQRAQRFLDALKPNGSLAQQLEAVASAPVEQLLEATKVEDFSRVEDKSLHFCPVMDSGVLPRHPFWPDAPVQSAHIPMVIGNTKDETRAFLGKPENFALTWADLPAKIRKQQFVDISPERVVEHYRKLYPNYSPSDIFFASTTAGRSWRGAVEELQVRAEQGSNTWAYQLDWGSPLDGGKYGAFHTLDIPLVFNNIHQPGSRTGGGEQALQVADTMSRTLLAFAHSGSPNAENLPKWEPYTLAERKTMVFDVPSQQHKDPRGAERKFYAKVPFMQRGTY
ncbi:carboxylesterase/lipase family protein [Gilvimarinus sp. SDUM040013]|uniref:Carboxylesterase/lipase family protein n=1 Tax=Gilvimarinus gilvus TaxID=3058038 RepID=A0ABU4S3B3_9GAMM|nr:carboxylesterase/lipase family protein [Gilvimarinus sp. SDUM040013]MDO3386246.1 carboxylesterase/lipase family protein [Gilvimarinus sp. SDUM040013]MDX6849759.1 carboxylesterase/lipase family protein [Gilvimarinus sp. SDUM040013]